jgi:hypothetical protein
MSDAIVSKRFCRFCNENWETPLDSKLTRLVDALVIFLPRILSIRDSVEVINRELLYAFTA